MSIASNSRRNRRRPSFVVRCAQASLGLLVLLAGCDLATCVAMPCPLPTAVVATVTSANGGLLTGLFVDVVSPTVGRIPCDDDSGRCVLPGNAGNYTLRLSATGYQTVERRVTVTRLRATTACGCDVVTTKQLSFTLVPL